jgi:hypothetical protein
MTTSSDIEELRSLLAGDGAWYVWVLEYGMTHHLMRLAFHMGDYPRSVEVMCSEASYFCGPLQGGPYRLQLIQDAAGNVAESTLESTDGALRLRGGAFKIVRRRL